MVCQRNEGNIDIITLIQIQSMIAMIRVNGQDQSEEKIKL